MSEATRFTLEGFGVVNVEPGASELADRRDRLKEAERAREMALAAVGVENIAQAEAKIAERNEAEANLKEATQLTAAYAPEGIDALRVAQRNKAAERERLNEGFDLSLAVNVGDPETETRALASARATEGTASAALDAALVDQLEHATRIAVAKQKVAAAEEACRYGKGRFGSRAKRNRRCRSGRQVEHRKKDLAEAERGKTETERQPFRRES